MDDTTTAGAPVSQRDTSVSDEAAALQHIIAELSPLSPGGRRRLIDTVCTFLGIDTLPPDRESVAIAPRQVAGERASTFHFSEVEEEPSVKAFLLQKSPTTDVERVACLAYYLAHLRATPHFETKDITSLNTEAAQRRFSNTAVAVDNATRTGYLVPSIKGRKQLSAIGERFVTALPDRAAAREIMEGARANRAGRAVKRTNTTKGRE